MHSFAPNSSELMVSNWRCRLSLSDAMRVLRSRRAGMLKNPLQQWWLNMFRFTAGGARGVRTDDPQTLEELRALSASSPLR